MTSRIKKSATKNLSRHRMIIDHDMEIVSSGQSKATRTQVTESNSEEVEDVSRFGFRRERIP